MGEISALKSNSSGIAVSALHFVDCVGRGAYFSSIALYLVRISSLDTANAGLVLSVGAVFGLIGNTVSGAVADKLRPRVFLSGLLFAVALTYALLPLAQTFVLLLIWSAISTLLHTACSAPFVMLITRSFDRKGSATGRALVRSFGNLGMSAGALISVLGLSVAPIPFLRSMPFIIAAATAAAALVTARKFRSLGASDAQDASLLHTVPRTRVWSIGLLTAVACTTVLTLHSSLLSVGYALFVAVNPGLPLATVPFIVLGNTVAVVLLQVNAASLAGDTLPGAVRWSRIGGSLLGVGCAALGLAVLFHFPTGAIALVIVSAVLATGAELLLNSAFFFFGVGVGPDHQRGAYASAFQNSHLIEAVLGPLLWGFLTSANTALGWILVAAVISVTALTYPIALRPLSASEARRLSQGINTADA